MMSVAYGKDKVQIIKDDKSFYSILLKTNDSLSIQAAEIISSYVFKSTGVRMQTVHVKEKNLGHIIIDSSLESNIYSPKGYSIHHIDGDIIIRGQGRSILYAAYRFVRDIIGARKWYIGDNNTFVPKNKELFMSMDYQIDAKPIFNFSEVYFPIETDREYMDWYGLDNLEEKWGVWGHTFSKILPPKQYFSQHPEYYSLYNGKRQALQLCLSNPDVLRLTKDYFREIIEDNPQAEYYSISANDDIGHCQCDLCSELDHKQGGAQGSLIHFVNQVAKEFPTKKFTVLAYLETANAPLTLHAADNVYIILCNINADKNQSLFQEKSAKSFRRQLENWKTKANHVFVWDYLTQFTNYLAPFPLQGTFQPSISYLESMGVEGVFLQGPGSTLGDMTELNAYILSNLVWNTHVDEKELTKEFLNGYYGKAARWVEQYLISRRENLNLSDAKLSIYGNPIDNRGDFLSSEAIDHYSTLLEKAEIAVEGDSVLESRVARIGLSLDYTVLQQARFYGPHKFGVFELKDNNWQLREQIKNKVERFTKQAERLGVIELSEGGLSPREYYAEWLEIFKKGPSINLAENAHIEFENPYDPYFPANGQRTLIDSVKGYLDYSYNWLLWNGTTMNALLKLENKKFINSIDISFLKDARHWIFPPQEIRIQISSDGKKFKYVYSQKLDHLDEDFQVDILNISQSINQEIKAIKVIAIPFDKLPAWRYHPKRNVMIACDEILLN